MATIKQTQDHARAKTIAAEVVQSALAKCSSQAEAQAVLGHLEYLGGKLPGWLMGLPDSQESIDFTIRMTGSWLTGHDVVVDE